MFRKGLTMIYTVISEAKGGKREAVLFPIAPDRVRIIARGRSDSMDLYSHDGQAWFTESGKAVRFDFLCGAVGNAALVMTAASAA